MAKNETAANKKPFIILLILVATGIITGAVAYVDIAHPFTQSIDENTKSVEILLRSKIIAGLSVGSLFLALSAYLIPVILKDIDTKRYHKELRNGIVSAGVFYLITLVLNKFDQKYYLKIAIGIIIISVLFLVLLNWILSRLNSKKDQVEIRTAIVGSIVSGILFSILIHFVTIGINFSRKKVDEVVPSKMEIQKKVEELIPMDVEKPLPGKKKTKNKK